MCMTAFFNFIPSKITTKRTVTGEQHHSDRRIVMIKKIVLVATMFVFAVNSFGCLANGDAPIEEIEKIDKVK